MRRADLLLFTRLGQPLRGVGAHRLQQPVPHLSLTRRRDQGLVNQRGDHVEEAARDVRGPAHLLGRAGRRAAAEHREAAQDPALGVIQQVPAPVHDGPQRLMPRQRGPAAVSRLKRSSSLPGGHLAGVSDRSRAAASSMASGLPSSARQIRMTGSAVTSSTLKPGRTAAPRSASSRTDP